MLQEMPYSLLIIGRIRFLDSIQPTKGVPMSTNGLICSYCNDASDFVTPFKGKTLLASTSMGEIIVALHTRCEELWADKNSCRTLVPLRKMRRARHSSMVGDRPVQ